MLILQSILQVFCSNPRKRTTEESDKTNITLQSEEGSFDQRNKNSESEQKIKLPSFQEAFGHLRPKVLVGLYQQEMVDTYQWPFCNQPSPEQYDYCQTFDNYQYCTPNADNTFVSNFTSSTSKISNTTIENENTSGFSTANIAIQAGNSDDVYYYNTKTGEDPNVVSSLIVTDLFLNQRQIIESCNVNQIPAAEDPGEKQLNSFENCSLSQLQASESDTFAKTSNTSSFSNTTITHLKLHNNEVFNEQNKTFDRNAFKKFVLTTHGKLSNLIDNIDEQISFHLSKEKIKECFIYGIFFDEELLVKEEFLFLIFVLPEIEVITRIYSQIKTKILNVDIFDDNLEEYQNVVRKLILDYNDVLNVIKTHDIFFSFTNIHEILDYFLMANKIEVQNFRKVNYNTLKLIFAECHSLRFYELLIKKSSIYITSTKLLSLVNMCFIVFLNQDWLIELTNGPLIFESIEFCNIISYHKDCFNTRFRVKKLIINLNNFVKLINREYFANSNCFIANYIQSNAQSKKNDFFWNIKTIQNGIVYDKKISMTEYLLLKYKIYCEELLSLYLSR